MSHFDFWSALTQASVIVQLVLLILVALLLLALAIGRYYQKTLSLIDEANKDFMKIFDLSRQGQLQVLENLYLQAKKIQFSPKAKIFCAMYGAVIKLNDELVAHQKPDIFYLEAEQVKDYIERAALEAQTDFFLGFDRYRHLLAMISNMGPFIGLFGTVWGIVHSFTGLAQSGGGMESVAPGIAEALIATAIGIGAAIPASIFFNLIAFKQSVLKQQVQQFIHDFHNQLERLLLAYHKDR